MPLQRHHRSGAETRAPPATVAGGASLLRRGGLFGPVPLAHRAAAVRLVFASGARQSHHPLSCNGSARGSPERWTALLGCEPLPPRGVREQRSFLRVGHPRLRHVRGQQLERNQPATSLPDADEARLEKAPSGVALSSYLVCVHECHHPEFWHVGPTPPRCANRVLNQLARQRVAFVAKGRAHPRAGPCVLGVFGEGPRCHP